MWGSVGNWLLCPLTYSFAVSTLTKVVGVSRNLFTLTCCCCAGGTDVAKGLAHQADERDSERDQGVEAVRVGGVVPRPRRGRARAGAAHAAHHGRVERRQRPQLVHGAIPGTTVRPSIQSFTICPFSKDTRINILTTNRRWTCFNCSLKNT